MTRPRASTVLRRFLDGENIDDLANWYWTQSTTRSAALRYVEHCIRRGLRGEVKVPGKRSKR